MSLTVNPSSLRGKTRVNADKSVTHRALLVAAVAHSPSLVAANGTGEDVGATVRLARALGARAEVAPDGEMRVTPAVEPPKGAETVDCSNSGTTARLGMGVAASFEGLSVEFTGDASLSRRPMSRVTRPLAEMGAGVAGGDTLPVRVVGARLRGIRHRPSVASAQVKSALLLAGTRADGETRVVERVSTRDHTERLLAWLGVPVERDGLCVSVKRVRFNGFELTVPGDLSNAAPIVVAACLAKRSEVRIEGVGLNPTRTRFLEVLRRMRCNVEWGVESDGVEPSGFVVARSSQPVATEVTASEVPLLIDELSLVALVAAFADGETRVAPAPELRVKESDRLAGTTNALAALGADVHEDGDELVVRGTGGLRGGTADARGDHRIAMALAAAGLASREGVTLSGEEGVTTSFPSFFEAIGALAR